MSTNKMRIVVTGANGFLAKNIRKFLSQNNVKTTSISRNDFKTYSHEAKLISKDLTEQKIIPKIKNYNALIHLIGTGKQSVNSTYDYVNVQLTKNTIDLCKKSGIKKIIFLSGLGTSKNSQSGYFISKYNAEQQILDSGLDFTIFRSSYIIGKSDPLTKNLKKQANKGVLYVPGSGKYKLQPIHVDDVTKIIFKSVFEPNLSNKLLDLVGPKIISYNHLIKLFSAKTNSKIQKIPLEVAYEKSLDTSNYIFVLDDLNILVGNYTGNPKKLENMIDEKLTPFTKILKICGLS